MSLEMTVDELISVLGAMTGIVRAYSDPPESLNEFPCLIAYVGSGTMEAVSVGFGKGLHTVIVEIHHDRQILPQAVDEAKVWPDRVLQALYAACSAGTLTLVWPFSYEALPLPYNQEVHYGVRFRITCKDIVTLT